MVPPTALAPFRRVGGQPNAPCLRRPRPAPTLALSPRLDCLDVSARLPVDVARHATHTRQPDTAPGSRRRRTTPHDARRAVRQTFATGRKGSRLGPRARHDAGARHRRRLGEHLREPASRRAPPPPRRNPALSSEPPRRGPPRRASVGRHPTRVLDAGAPGRVRRIRSRQAGASLRVAEDLRHRRFSQAFRGRHEGRQTVVARIGAIRRERCLDANRADRRSAPPKGGQRSVLERRGALRRHHSQRPRIHRCLRRVLGHPCRTAGGAAAAERGLVGGALRRHRAGRSKARAVTDREAGPSSTPTAARSGVS